MIEKWKPIKYYPKYQVSNLGRIYSLKTNKILKTNIDKDGYERVTVCIGNKPITLFVHRLVAQAFLENPNNLPTVNHKDENKLNNNANNLEYMSNKDNVRYSQAKKVYQYTKTLKLIKIWDSVMDIERNLKFSSGSISQCCNNISKSSHNYIWSYTPLN